MKRAMKIEREFLVCYGALNVAVVKFPSSAKTILINSVGRKFKTPKTVYTRHIARRLEFV